MAFNAQWEFENLAQELGKPVPTLFDDCKLDFQEMVTNCQVYRLVVSDNGNKFLLLNKSKDEFKPPEIPRLYSIFTPDRVIYLGEATNLYRRQLSDSDNTADSHKRFNNQIRAILKLILTR